MAAKVRHQQSSAPPSPQRAKHLEVQREEGNGRPPALSALSEAAARYSRHPSTSENAAPANVYIGIPSIAALLVATLVVFAGAFEYRCIANFLSTGPLDFQSQKRLRSDLLSQALSHTNPHESVRAASADWNDSSLDEHRLQLSLLTTSWSGRSEILQTIVEDFLDQHRNQVALHRATPTEIEKVLQLHADSLTNRLQEAQRERDGASKILSASDPRIGREETLDQWHALRGQFAKEQAQLNDAQADLHRLHTEPATVHALVSPEARRKAIDQDASLQQDLRQLTVALTELRSHALRASRTITERLDSLTIAAAQFIHTVMELHVEARSTSQRAELQELLDLAGPFRDALSAFQALWTQRTQTLTEETIDPQSNGVLTHHQDLLALSLQFPNETSAGRDRMREAMTRLESQHSGNAEQYVFLSTIVRDFQKMRAAYGQFELAAADLNPSHNFRLDGVRRSAQGLFQRSQDQIRMIEERLQRDALDEAARQREAALKKAEQVLAEARGITDARVHQLVQLQDELALAVAPANEFVSATARAKTAAEQIASIGQELQDTQARLVELQAARVSEARNSELKLISLETPLRPANLEHRLALGSGAGLFTFFCLMLAQWLTLRRR